MVKMNVILCSTSVFLFYGTRALRQGHPEPVMVQRIKAQGYRFTGNFKWTRFAWGSIKIISIFRSPFVKAYKAYDHKEDIGFLIEGVPLFFFKLNLMQFPVAQAMTISCLGYSWHIEGDELPGLSRPLSLFSEKVLNLLQPHSPQNEGRFGTSLISKSLLLLLHHLLASAWTTPWVEFYCCRTKLLQSLNYICVLNNLGLEEIFFLILEELNYQVLWCSSF